ncbi:AAA family ATPase [Marinilabilia salmonicolor]|uniref:AAA domain-containing protein n=1 Tax=Marinilabilia salmonicolor TaxID=989 RepID=A0A368VDP5_9BACT|nr:AAA family ATPase [Marinilabilia salmonicolor]RCW38365.1 AAA domain-containing protein [Marinilabilia salmonicolor]
MNNNIFPEGFISLDHLKQDHYTINAHFERGKNASGALIIQEANKWVEQARLRPAPKMLFDEFWFENELCVLFADTNVGKSILAVQIADSISKGIPIEGFRFTGKPMRVLYCDFELSDKQFELRYSEEKKSYRFSKRFFRAEINPDCELPEGVTDMEQYINISLEQLLSTKQSEVLIIDNLTYLRTGTEKASDALPLMKSLKSIKRKYNVSILVLAHTPKRDLTKPLTKNDLQGSKMLINFVDSCFAIGESNNESSQRYLKQIKVRNASVRYDTTNVVVTEIIKEDAMVRFQFIEYDYEFNHLKVRTEEEIQELDQQIVELKKSNPSLSYQMISEQLNTNKTRVMRVLKRADLS